MPASSESSERVIAMHELSLTRLLVEQVCAIAQENGGRRIARVSVRIGVMSAAIRSVYFCFDAATRDTLCEGARLEIEPVAVTVWCPACEAVRTPSGPYSFRCVDCGAPTPKILSGRETELVLVEFRADTGDGPRAGMAGGLA